MHSEDMRSEFSALAMSFKHSGVPIAIFDSSLALIFANESLISLYPDADSPFFALKVFGDCDVETVLNYLKSEKRYNAVCKLDGEEPTSLSADAIFDREGNVIGAFIIFSEKEKNTDFLSDSECMMAVKREFTDRLSSIFNYVSGIANSKNLNADEADCEYINGINQHCYQLHRVSDNLARFLSLTSQNDSAKFSHIDLSTFLLKLVGTIIVMDNALGVPVEFKCRENDIVVKADIKRLEFALVNIILNSIKYTKDGNCVEVELATVGNNAVITISDKGIGMPKDVLSRVGEPYFSYSHDNKFEAGFGIGLYIAKKYIASNGGLFAIQSKQNEGTVVTVSLPLCDENGGDVTLSSPTEFNPKEAFSVTRVQLSEVCYYPKI